MAHRIKRFSCIKRNNRLERFFQTSVLHYPSHVYSIIYYLDCELTFSTHINLLSRDCSYQLCQLRTVTRSLPASATATLVHALLQTGLTTAPPSILASLPVDWGVWIRSCVLLPA